MNPELLKQLQSLLRKSGTPSDATTAPRQPAPERQTVWNWLRHGYKPMSFTENQLQRLSSAGYLPTIASDAAPDSPQSRMWGEVIGNVRPAMEGFAGLPQKDKASLLSEAGDQASYFFAREARPGETAEDWVARKSLSGESLRRPPVTSSRMQDADRAWGSPLMDTLRAVVRTPVKRAYQDTGVEGTQVSHPTAAGREASVYVRGHSPVSRLLNSAISRVMENDRLGIHGSSEMTLAHEMGHAYFDRMFQDVPGGVFNASAYAQQGIAPPPSDINQMSKKDLKNFFSNLDKSGQDSYYWSAPWEAGAQAFVSAIKFLRETAPGTMSRGQALSKIAELESITPGAGELTRRLLNEEDIYRSHPMRQYFLPLSSQSANSATRNPAR